MKDTKITYSIEEARRYVANAEDVIQKAKYDPDTQSYMDSKYVRTAGDILWKGCLIALDTVFQVRKGKGRPSIEKYRDAVAKRDGKLLSFVNFLVLYIYVFIINILIIINKTTIVDEQP